MFFVMKKTTAIMIERIPKAKVIPVILKTLLYVGKETSPLFFPLPRIVKSRTY